MIAVAIASLVLISGGWTSPAAFIDLPVPFLMSGVGAGGQVDQAEWQKLADERDQLMKEQKFAEALPLARRVVEVLRKEKPNSVELGKALTTIADLHERLGQLNEADKVLEEALSILQQGAGPGSLPIAAALHEQGRVAYGKQNLKLAREKWEQALAIYERLVPNSFDVANNLNNLGVVASNRGDLEEAQRRYEAALAIRERLAPGSLSVAASLNNLGNVAADRGDLDGAWRRYEAALAIRERLAPGSLDVAASLHNLGNIALHRGDLEGAQRRFEAALSIRERLAPGSGDVAASLNNLGMVAHDRGDFEGAQRRYETALAILERLTPGSLSVAASLNNLGNVAADRGDLEEAQRRYETALAIREKLAPGSLSVAASLNNLGTIAKNRNDLEEAQRRFGVALAIVEKLAPGSQSLAILLTNLGFVAHDRGDLEEAQRRYETALAILERLVPGSQNLAMLLINLGNVAADRGDLEEAQRRYEAALAIRERLAPGSSDVAASLNNLGTIAQQRNDLESAQRWFKAALALNEKRAPGSPDVAASLNNLGMVASDRGDLDEAQRQYGAALAIMEKLAPSSPEVAAILVNLGTVASDRGDLEVARRRYEAALPILERLASGSNNLANCLNNLGIVAKKGGDLERAQRRYEAALAIREKIAPGSLAVARSLNNLGEVLDRRARFDDATRTYRKLAEVLAIQIETGYGLADAGISRLAETESARMIAETPQRHFESVYEAILRVRSLQSRTGLTSQIQDLVARDPDLKTLRSKALETRKRADDFALDPEVEPVMTEAAARAASSASLDFLSQLKKKHGTALRLIPPSRAELQAKLGTDGAVVDFYRRTDRDKPYYLAVVTLGTGQPHFIEVGSEAAIETAVRELQELMNGSNGAGNAEAIFARLDELTFRKLDKVLKGKTRVYVVADGVIAQIPLAGLVTGVKPDKSSETGKRTAYRIEDMALRLVPSPLEPGLRPSGASGEGSVIVADIDPNLEVSAAQVKPSAFQFAKPPKPNETKGDGLDENGNWTILSYAEEEIKKLKATETLRYAQVWRKGAATEEQLLKLKSPRYLIISAHGFFTEKDDKKGDFKRSAIMSQLAKADDSMFRSGLVLSGANHADELRKQGKYDGLLTAADAARLNLRGTRLVVLSACQSGRGDFSAGMGVLGLRRAFRTAGAQGVVMSLFNVPNQSTAELMALFFKNVKEGSDNAEALRKAQLEMKKKNGPYHWAGFVYEGG
ncbi:MAG: tetratricopeptide repeat protein [Fimbriimonadaceae bacterium]|nr:tetratricopeptide repeat protein [Fimbriimonadaceae bacterium]